MHSVALLAFWGIKRAWNGVLLRITTSPLSLRFVHRPAFTFKGWLLHLRIRSQSGATNSQCTYTMCEEID